MNNSPGSAMIVMFAMLSMVTALVLSGWFVASLQVDIIVQRELWYKKMYAAEVILNAGQVLACQQFSTFMVSKDPTVLDFSVILEQAELLKLFDSATLKFYKSSDMLELTAVCFTKNSKPFHLRCLLSPQSGLLKNKGRIKFVVQAFDSCSGI